MGACFYCGVSLLKDRHKPYLYGDDKASRDHIYPRSMLVDLTPEQTAKLPANFHTLNTVEACHKCNAYKGMLHPLDWLVIMPNSFNAHRLSERLVKMGENMTEVFDALRRRRK